MFVVPTPLRTGNDGIHVGTGVTLEATRLMLTECYAWGAMGFDLEWAPDGRITWIGLGTAKRGISLWRPTLPNEVMDMIRTAAADPNLVKIAHNIQADIQSWEREEGPVGGLWEDTMLLHHAAFPGLAHDLQNVVSQFCVVPPWKVWHKQAQLAAKERTKEFKLQEKAALKQREKDAREAERLATRDARELERAITAQAKAAQAAAKKEEKAAQKEEKAAQKAEKAVEKAQSKTAKDCEKVHKRGVGAVASFAEKFGLTSEIEQAQIALLAISDDVAAANAQFIILSALLRATKPAAKRTAKQLPLPVAPVEESAPTLFPRATESTPTLFPRVASYNPPATSLLQSKLRQSIRKKPTTE